MSDLKTYQAFTDSTAIYPKDQELSYVMLGLMSEVGEIADKLKKHIRDGNGEPMNDQQIIALQKEMGDVLWYLARLHQHYNLSMEHTLLVNMTKLQNRKASNTLSGSGDER